MSSKQPFPHQTGLISKLTTVGEINHIHHLSEHLGSLCMNDDYSDVTLVVEGARFPGHRVVLAARSDYFRALLFGGMKESQLDEIELKDTPLNAFKFLLRYIYSGHMTLGNLKDEVILEILGLAHQYGFLDLETAISDYLKAILNIRNVCLIYDTAALYQLCDLIAACFTFADKHASEVIAHDSFATLSAAGVKDIISRDSFCASEVDIFRAVCAWVKSNAVADASAAGAAAAAADDALWAAHKAAAADILSAVRLSLMSTQDLMKVVRPTGLVLPDVLLDAIQSKTECRDMELKYRGYMIPDENVATASHGAAVTLGEVKAALLDGDSKNYDMERGFSRHPIDDSQDRNGIIIRLGMQCIVNHLRMLLWDKDQRAYSYYIDVSMDEQDWVRVVDHSKYNCRSWQDMYFAARVVRYIRIVGTHNTVNKVFHVVSLEAYYTKTPFKLDPQGIVVPQSNVATIPRSACVIEGVCRSRNALLNGDIKNYDWDSGYTCHQLGSGAIVVQLGQPYALSSMRLLLWDCDDRSYSYYVEVSNNQRDWELVCDRSREACRAWQTVTFPRRPVVYIRIVGTHNTANEVFHCVHVESPAVTDAGGRAGAGGGAGGGGGKAKGTEQSLNGSTSSRSSSSGEESAGDDGLAGAAGGAEAAAAAVSIGGAAVAAAAEKNAILFPASAAAGESGEEVDAAVAGVDAEEEVSPPPSSSHRSSPASFSGASVISSATLPVGASAVSLARAGSQFLPAGPSSFSSTAAVFSANPHPQSPPGSLPSSLNNGSANNQLVNDKRPSASSGSPQSSPTRLVATAAAAAAASTAVDERQPLAASAPPPPPLRYQPASGRQQQPQFPWHPPQVQQPQQGLILSHGNGGAIPRRPSASTSGDSRRGSSDTNVD